MQRDRSCAILENNVLKSKTEVLKSMFVISNKPIKLYTKIGFCVPKFDRNCVQNLISGNFGTKFSSIFSSSYLELSFVTLEVGTRLPLQDVQILYLMCWDLYTVHLYAYTGTINVF